MSEVAGQEYNNINLFANVISTETFMANIGIGTKKYEKPLFRLPSKDNPERKQNLISVLLAQNDGLLCVSDNTSVC